VSDRIYSGDWVVRPDTSLGHTYSPRLHISVSSKHVAMRSFRRLLRISRKCAFETRARCCCGNPVRSVFTSTSYYQTRAGYERHGWERVHDMYLFASLALGVHARLAENLSPHIKSCKSALSIDLIRTHRSFMRRPSTASH
jgi:hypothetical protein